MVDYKYLVIVTTDTNEHATQVIGERLSHDEDYGFAYEIGIELVSKKEE